MATLSQRLQAEIDRANATTSKTDTTVHNAVTSLIDGYGQGGTEKVEWNQCPEAPRNFVNNVTYDPNDYTTTEITSYMLPSITPTSETKALYTHPIGKTVDGITYYNQVPNTETPFASTSKAGTLKPLDRLRWIKGGETLYNCRDLGGWNCDGGTVKYGLLFRGNENKSDDRDALVGDCGVRRELDLRGSDVNITSSPLGTDIKYYRNPDYTWYSLSPTDTWKENLSFIFEGVKYNEPIYFHCSAGADRTGTLACILEALLGMSQSDIDKDYELTSFSTGTDTDAHARRRNEPDWKGLITQINELTNGNTFRDKVVNWVASLGFSEDEINSFRKSMINGNPEDIHIIVTQYSITNNLSHTTNSNSSTAINENSPYTATIEPESGYILNSITVTMGGVDITSSVYDNGTINIPSVSGDIVITATSTVPIVNLFDVSQATLNERFTSSGTTAQNGFYITGYINASAGDVIYVKPAFYDPPKKFQKVNCYGSTDTKIGARLLTQSTSSTETPYVIENGVGHFTVPNVNGTTRIRIGLQITTDYTNPITESDLSNVVITKNQEIS